MSKALTFHISAAAIALAFSSSVSAQVLNGGFETPATTPGGFTQYFAGQSINGNWLVGGSDILVLNNTYSEASGAGPLTFNSHTGANALDITGSGNTGANTVTQTLNLGAGSYILEFFLGRINDTGAASPNYSGNSSVSLMLGGVNFGSFFNTTNSIGTVNWLMIDVPFTVVAPGSFNLVFTNTTPAGNNYAGLDDIRVFTAVPEPSTWIGSMAACLTVGSMLVRRVRARRA